MTKREKQFVLIGVLFGMVLAAVFYGISHRLHDSGVGDLNMIVPAQAQDSEPDSSAKSSEVVTVSRCPLCS